jgi:hypothetical protein
MPTQLQQRNKEQEGQAAYERWVQSELSESPKLTVLRVLYNDIRDRGEPLPETWDYFDMQEQTGAAESLDTQHITELEGVYDAATDEIVAATAGGERVTYDSFTVSGLIRAKERAAQNPDFAFQLTRDQIFHDNFHGPIKEMWRRETDYDTVMYVSTFPQDVIDTLGERGRMLIRDLAYDENGKKGFVYGYRKNKTTGKMDGFAMRLGNSTPEFFGAYLQKRGKNAGDVAAMSSHEYGGAVIFANTGDTPIKEVARGEAAIFDEAARELTGKRHHFGREEEGIDAFELFKQLPNLKMAYRHYHLLLARHLNGVPLHDDLYDYLVTLRESTGFHVLDGHNNARLERQLDNGKITADMALACKNLMTYSHYATLSEKLKEFRRTGVVTDIDGADIMQAYGSEAGDSGGGAASRGETLSDCESSYGEQSAAAEMADRMGISLEEAMRRLTRQERWSEGECRNCERTTQVWAEEDGGCNVCRKCANEHTVWGQQGLDRERRRAQAEREMAERWRKIIEVADLFDDEAHEDDAKNGTTRYVAGHQQMLTRQMTIGGAKHVWIDTTTGQAVDDE